MGKGRNSCTGCGRFFFAVLLVLFPLISISRAQSNAWDIAVLNKILANVPPGQSVAQVGDMFISVSVLQASLNQLTGGGVHSQLAFDGGFHAWTSGTVFYSFSNNVSTAHQKAFLDGMNEWAMFANLHFTARTTQSNYVTVVDGGTNQEGGDSAVGMIGGQQFIHMGSTSWNRPTICHEFGHTLGLIHEQSRSDRDSNVVILTSNILPGQEGNFVKLTNSLNKTAYDFLSIMEYSRNQLSISTNLDTIEPLPAFSQYLNLMGQADPVLSQSDRAGMALVYGTPATAVTNIVTNTQDSGAGSLRAAMYYAFDHPGTTIRFNILTSDPGFSNTVFNILPSGALPSLVNGMVIDGSTEPTNSNPNGPEIVLNGSLLNAGDTFANGVHMTGTNCAVRSLVINNFNLNGVAIEGTNAVGNVVAGCYIGTDPTGTASANNAIYDVLIDTLAHSNTVGGTTVGARNLISGSAFQGLVLSGACVVGNSVVGNYIGLNANGTAALPNGGAGVFITASASSNTIGGAVANDGNVISGNGAQGIVVFDAGSDGNIFQGNYIGLNAAGNAAIPNTLAGIELNGGQQFTVIGGTLSAARNVISGNPKQGIAVFSANSNIIQGNYIGLNVGGTNAVPNQFAGIEINGGSQSNLVGGLTTGSGNILSGNNSQGLFIDGSNTVANVVEGNFIGTDSQGVNAIGNQFAGVEINGGAQSNVIGGTTLAAHNVISGNLAQGIFIDGLNTDDNQIRGNYIGVNVTGAAMLGNGFSGIEINSGARSNFIGSTISGGGNVISGNANYGVFLNGAGTDGTFIQGNFIGVDLTGAIPIPNVFDGVNIQAGVQHTLVGGTAPGARNVISGNLGRGVGVLDPGTKNNLVQGNFIGVNTAGNAAVGNGFTGVNLGDGCQSNTVGGGIDARNIISGNSNSGIIIEDTNTDANVIQGNTIGLDATSTLAVPNQFAGIALFGAASSNQIGGTTFGSANLIASNGTDGIQFFDATTTNNSVLGNSIFGNLGSGIGQYTGSENSQAAPVLNSATLGTNTVVAGSLASLPSKTFRIEFFANPAGSSAQGRTFLGAINAITGGAGTVNFSAGFASTVPVGQLITATATDPAGNTSPFSNVGTVTTTDSVGDGIPNAWRAAFFGGSGNTTNSSSCATCDPDHDGLTNLQEFHAGTNPQTNSSAFRAISTQKSGPDVTVTFSCVAGRIYRVEKKDDLSLATWTLLVDQLVGPPLGLSITNFFTITDPGAASLPKRFYRADVLP